MKWIEYNKIKAPTSIYGIQQGARQYCAKGMTIIQKNEDYAIIQHSFGDLELVNNKTLFLIKTPS